MEHRLVQRADAWRWAKVPDPRTRKAHLFQSDQGLHVSACGRKLTRLPLKLHGDPDDRCVLCEALAGQLEMPALKLAEACPVCGYEIQETRPGVKRCENQECKLSGVWFVTRLPRSPAGSSIC